MDIYKEIDRLGGVTYLTMKKKKGYNAKEVAEEIGCEYRNIYIYLQKHGLRWSMLTGSRDLISEAGGIDFLREEKRKGRTQEAIALDLGYSESSPIRRFLNRQGYSWSTLLEGEPVKRKVGESKGKKQMSCKNLRRRLEKEGLEFLKERFSEGLSIRDISEEFECHYNYFASVVRDFLDDNGVTKEDLGYYAPRHRNYKKIEDKGGLAFLLDCKVRGLTLDGVGLELGVSYPVLQNYLRFMGVEWRDLHSVDDVYFIHHLNSWRGSFVHDGRVRDTVLCDSVWEALEKVRLLKKK